MHAEISGNLVLFYSNGSNTSVRLENIRNITHISEEDLTLNLWAGGRQHAHCQFADKDRFLLFIDTIKKSISGASK